MAPLGKPVVPEVYWILTTSSELAAAWRRCSSAGEAFVASRQNALQLSMPGGFVSLMLITWRRAGQTAEGRLPAASSGQTSARTLAKLHPLKQSVRNRHVISAWLST